LSTLIAQLKEELSELGRIWDLPTSLELLPVALSLNLGQRSITYQRADAKEHLFSSWDSITGGQHLNDLSRLGVAGGPMSSHDGDALKIKCGEAAARQRKRGRGGRGGRGLSLPTTLQTLNSVLQILKLLLPLWCLGISSFL